jgi:hypothetical protein
MCPSPVNTLYLQGADGPAFLLIWAEPPIWNAQTFSRLGPLSTTVTVSGTAATTALDILSLDQIPLRPGQGGASLEFRSRPVLVALG